MEATVPLSPACLAALGELAARSGKVRDLVCLRPSRTTWEKRNVYPFETLLRYFVIAKKLAGITRRLRWYDLRHTFGSALASEGVSLQVIAKAMGHASTRMSERYARPDAEALRSVAAALTRRNQSIDLNSALNSCMQKESGRAGPPVVTDSPARGYWSGTRDLNSRHLPWQGSALPLS